MTNRIYIFLEALAGCTENVCNDHYHIFTVTSLGPASGRKLFRFWAAESTKARIKDLIFSEVFLQSGVAGCRVHVIKKE